MDIYNYSIHNSAAFFVLCKLYYIILQFYIKTYCLCYATALNSHNVGRPFHKLWHHFLQRSVVQWEQNGTSCRPGFTNPHSVQITGAYRLSGSCRLCPPPLSLSPSATWRPILNCCSNQCDSYCLINIPVFTQSSHVSLLNNASLLSCSTPLSISSIPF